jgi:UDP-N-acetylglucosamine 3-dehydrogenase
VFLEKPIASTVADAQKIIAAAEGARGILFIGHVVRFNPRYRMAKQAIDAGRIGKIVALTARRNIPAVWTETILQKIGPIVGDAIHDTDIMLWLTGDRIVSAYAQTVDVRGLKHPDIGHTMYRFAGGASATLETVWYMPDKSPFDIDERMSIVGTEGIIHIQDTFPNLAIVDGDKLHSPDTTYWPMVDGVRGGALRDEFIYFVRKALAGERPDIGRPEDAAAALEACLAAEESARSGTIIRIG